MGIKGTKTEKNLLKSFAGESQARNRYDFFAKVAKNEGYEQISAVFTETALQEKTHAKNFFKALEGSELEITASYPAGKIGTTVENLKASAHGENEEYTMLYPEFAKIAEEEGFKDIALLYRNVSIAEKHHEQRFLKLLKHIENGTTFKRDSKVTWVCRECGFIHEGNNAPEKCPACQHPKAYYQLMEEEF